MPDESMGTSDARSSYGEERAEQLYRSFFYFLGDECFNSTDMRTVLKRGADWDLHGKAYTFSISADRPLQHTLIGAAEPRLARAICRARDYYDPQTLLWAVNSLSMIGDATDVPIFRAEIERLLGQDPDERIKGMWAACREGLARFGSESDLDILLKVVTEDSNWLHRSNAARLLAARAGPGLADAVRDVLRELNSAVDPHTDSIQYLALAAGNSADADSLALIEDMIARIPENYRDLLAPDPYYSGGEPSESTLTGRRRLYLALLAAAAKLGSADYFHELKAAHERLDAARRDRGESGSAARLQARVLGYYRYIDSAESLGELLRIWKDTDNEGIRLICGWLLYDRAGALGADREEFMDWWSGNALLRLRDLYPAPEILSSASFTDFPWP